MLHLPPPMMMQRNIAQGDHWLPCSRTSFKATIGCHAAEHCSKERDEHNAGKQVRS